MAKISQAYVAKMALIIRNYHLVPVGDNSLYKTYLSAIFSAMEFSDNQKDDSIQRTLLPILKGSYDELVKNFLVNDRGTFRSINLRGIGTHEDVIRMHFKTYS